MRFGATSYADGSGAFLSYPVRMLMVMRVLTPNMTSGTTTDIDPYDNPVEYLRELGIEAELIAILEVPLERAA